MNAQTHTARAHMKPHLVGVAMVVLLCAMVGLAWADGATATITGQVRAAGDGTPVPGAMVTLRMGRSLLGTTRTDHAGQFRLRTSHTGPAVLQVRQVRFATWRSAVRLQVGATVRVRVALRRVVVAALAGATGRSAKAKRPRREYEESRSQGDVDEARPAKPASSRRFSRKYRGFGWRASGVGPVRSKVAHSSMGRSGMGRSGSSGAIGSGVGLMGKRARVYRGSARRFWRPQRPQPTASREGYAHTPDGDFHSASQRPLSTFSIDVDTASYSNVRRFIQRGRLPPADAVRIEELLNYFPYRTAAPTSKTPFSVAVELTPAPWNPAHRLARIAVQGRKVAMRNLPPANLVFLIDVSGSMHSQKKLPLLKRSLTMLSAQLRPQDRVSIVVYAGAAGLVLPPTSGDEQQTIVAALAGLRAGGSTAGGAGLKLAYRVARQAFRRGGNNRVILCTDGDFNVGQSSDGALVRMIEKQRETGIFLTVLGFGTGNYQDAKMQQLANKGNGNHAYIDSLREARKVLVEQIGGTLFTIAKDVKIQVEFNPSRVASYRLIGYANRKLAARDFKDDKKDAGELGAGHHVTALYELIPVSNVPQGSGLRYQTKRATSVASSGELMHVKLRWKTPQGSKSKLASFPVSDLPGELAQSSQDHRFAAAVAGFGMLLRHSKHLRTSADYTWRWRQMLQLAQGAVGDDPGGYRAAFIRLARRAARLSGE